MTTRLPGGVLLVVLWYGLAVHAGPVGGQGTWESTLHARDIDRDGVVDAFYDSTLDITWLADWNSSSSLGWEAALAWADTLDVHGFTGWRLPKVTDYGDDGCGRFVHGGGPGTDCGYNVDTSGSELAHLFYVTLGNLALCPPGDVTCNDLRGIGSGYGLTNTAHFRNMELFYWSGTTYATNPDLAWFFSTFNGEQNYAEKYFSEFPVIAARPGDVAMRVPAPGVAGLLLASICAWLLVHCHHKA